jgi:hypothetical protein
VEITLPTVLQVLEGTNCLLIVRDGPRPEIVLQPDLAAAQDLFQTLWQKIQLGLGEIGELPDFSLADFTPTFFPLQHWQERPPLSYADALIIIQRQDHPGSNIQGHRVSPSSSHFHNGKNHSAGDPRTPERGGGEDAVTRVLAAFVVNAGYYLGLQGRFALAFGDSVAYLVTGNPTSLGADFERGMAHRLFWGDPGCYCQGEDCFPQPFSHPFDDRAWQQARPGLRRVFDQFLTWQETPTTCTVARDQWYRALTAELKTL